VKIVDESFQEIIRLCLLYARHYKMLLCSVLNFTLLFLNQERRNYAEEMEREKNLLKLGLFDEAFSTAH